MSDETTQPLISYQEVFRFIATMIGVDAGDCDYDYYPLCPQDTRKGFLELILPVADSSGRLLRGASGNGPIFIFLYCQGHWTYLGQMHGTKVTADVSGDTTEFIVHSHLSASEAIERRYQLRAGQYVCVSEALAQ